MYSVVDPVPHATVVKIRLLGPLSNRIVAGNAQSTMKITVCLPFGDGSGCDYI
jgi:hypothetical protein